MARLQRRWPTPGPRAANFGLATTTSGVRLLATVDNANYWPVVSRWTGSSFSPPHLTGDKATCTPSSHDPVADASGRMADVFGNCGDRGGRQPDRYAARGRRPVRQRRHARRRPARSSPPRRAATAGSSGPSRPASANKLMAVPVLLPGRDVTAKATSARATRQR